jgi:hypothetical protein
VETKTTARFLDVLVGPWPDPICAMSMTVQSAVKSNTLNQRTQFVFAGLRELLATDQTLYDRMQVALEATDESVEDIGAELCQFLCDKSDVNGEMLSPTVIVDLVWHEFILHTEVYRDFCLKHFGKFIDHRPFPSHAPSTSTRS